MKFFLEFVNTWEVNKMIKLIVIVLFLIGAFLEFFKIELKSLRINFRKGDISAYISGTIFALIALIIYLFG